MNSLFGRLGTVTAHRPRTVIAVWLVLLAGGAVLAPRLSEDFQRPLTAANAGESQVAADMLARDFGAGSSYQEALVVTSAARTVDDPAYRSALVGLLAAAQGTGRVASVESDLSGAAPPLVSTDRHTTYALLGLTSRTHADGMIAAQQITAAVAAAGPPSWLHAYVTGEEAAHADLTVASQISLERAETVGLPVALVVLALVFGALVAAALPLAIGLVGITIALALAYLVGQWVDLSVFVQNFAVMLGLGIGIDYSLFLLSRYRAERRAGRAVDEALIGAVTHAGRAIAFSGLTVAIGLLALLATGDPTTSSIGLGGVLVVPVTLGAALTLLPAAVALLGDRLERPRALARAVGRLHRSGFWSIWAQHVMRRPLVYLLASLAVLGILAAPALAFRTGCLGTGVSILPADAQSRQGAELLARDFGAGLVSPVEIVVRSPSGAAAPRTLAGIDALTRAIERDPRFASVVSLTTLVPGTTLTQDDAMYADGFAGVPLAARPALAELVDLAHGADATVIEARLAQDPGDATSQAAVHDLRTRSIPSIPELAGDTALVGGGTALEMDMVDAIVARLPLVVGLILAATFVLLLVLLRSVLIPLKAIAMNLLSVAAAYGLLVAVFQFGWGAGLLGIRAPGSVQWEVAILLFATLFGLSMDYEVFLASRIREGHDAGLSNEDAVAHGLEQTGGVITGAAGIMVVVFGAFALSPIMVMKELGFGLAVAVLIDATLVRVVLVPATMRLMGHWNWWLPGPLERRWRVLVLEDDGSPRASQQPF